MAIRADVFFYGLFMDAAILRSKGVQPGPGRVAVVHGWALRIGQRATMVPSVDSEVHGVVMSVALPELERLYAEPSVSMYQPVAVEATALAGERSPVLAFVLPEPPSSREHNAEYAAKLRVLGEGLGLPAGYLRGIA